MSDKWATYFARANKVYIEPPQHLDKKYDDLLLGITGNLTHEDRMAAARELCELFNTRTDTQEVEQLRKELEEARESTPTFVRRVQRDNARQERDELAAYVERLHLIINANDPSLLVAEEAPPHSLVEHDNEVIDRCAEIGDKTIILDDLLPPNTTVGDLIRALKIGENEIYPSMLMNMHKRNQKIINVELAVVRVRT